MEKSFFLWLFFLTLFLYRIYGQVIPIYGNSAKFQTNLVSTKIPSTQSSSPYTFTITPSGLKSMSTLGHQRPFISISGIQKLQTDNSKNIYLLSQITYSASSFDIALDFTVSGVNIYSWVKNVPIKFYYMLIDSTFPDTYICGQLDIINSMTNLVNQPDSKTSNQNLNSWIGSNVVSLSAGDSQFIYAITQLEIHLTSANDQYSINIVFNPTSNTNFDVTVNTVYSQKILQLRVSLFIYSVTVFDTYLIKIIHNFYTSSSLANGISSVSQSYTGWNVYSGMQLIIGWAGLEFSGQPLMGFQFTVDTSLTSTTLNLQVKNIHNSIPKLQVTIFSISQLKCPNGQTFINVAKTECYVTCPIGTYAGTVITTTTLTECSPCTIANCISCSSATTCTLCTSGYFVSTGTCSPCITYNQQCLTCDQTQCLSCAPDYFYRSSTSSCQLLSSVVCGDSDWVYEIEACDDANTIDNDGCSSDCKVEDDYVCLIADQLPSGASFCKYNRNFYLDFFYLEKEVSSNTVHLFFKLEPSTFNYWTQQTVEMLLNPVTIVDSDTGNIQTIPVNSLNLIFTRNNNININQIELIIDYEGSNLEGSFLQFNIQPSSTGLTSITHLTTQNNLHLKIDSEKSGVYLFSYDQETYNFQSLISTLSLVVGLMAFMMMILGCFLPVGKLIVLEALAVVQISYFSLMQFKKIPPTFIGLKNLMFSNGYNVASMFGSSTSQQSFQDVFKLMGMERSVLSNDNISLIVFVILPLVIGSIGYMLTRFYSSTKQEQHVLVPIQTIKSQPPSINSKLLQLSYDFSLKIINPTSFFSDQKQNDEDFMVESEVQEGFQIGRKVNKYKQKIQKISQQTDFNKNQVKKQQGTKGFEGADRLKTQQNLTLARIVFQRIFCEMTFYGIMMISYLSWFSIQHSFPQSQTTTYIFLGVFSTVSILYSVLFTKSSENSIDLNRFLKQEEATRKIFTQQHFIWTSFGEFSQVYNQITVCNYNNVPNLKDKFYLIFMLERLFSTTLIVLLPQIMNYVSLLLIFIYGIILLVMVIIYRKSLNVDTTNKIENILQSNDQNKDPIKTDLLRKQNQIKPIKTIPQRNKKSSIFSYLHRNYILRQSINISIIIIIQGLYLYTNIIINSSEHSLTFTNNFFIIQALPITVLAFLIINMLFNQFLWVKELKSQKLFEKCKIMFYCIFKQKFQKQLQKMRLHMDQLSQTQRQQAEVVKMINNFMEKSTLFQPKDNPFLGIKEKQKQEANEALLDMLKIEDKNLQIPLDVKKRKNWLIEKYWEHI